jgi:hypothetical protein
MSVPGSDPYQSIVMVTPAKLADNSTPIFAPVK